MTDLTVNRGVLTQFTVSCWSCGRKHRFFPPHDMAWQARRFAFTIGWKRHARKGWCCAPCNTRQQKNRRTPGQVQVMLPGFAELSRNTRDEK